MQYENYLDLLEKRYSHYYDIIRNFNFCEVSFPLYARYFERNERYIGTKKMVIYGMEQNEHVFFQTYDTLSINKVEEFTKILERAAIKLVTPTEDHMSTLVRGVIVTKQAPDRDVLKKIKKYKFYKSFHFGFHGWVNIGLNVVDINHLTERSYHNKAGKGGSEHLFV